jgi:hypothetical protein
MILARWRDWAVRPAGLCFAHPPITLVSLTVRNGRTEVRHVADIFISYTSSDRDWAHWIAKELETLGHVPHVHEWEIKGGADIYAWMEARHDAADHVLCVVSDAYMKAPFSTLERNAALWQAAGKRARLRPVGGGQAMRFADACGPSAAL